MNGREHIDIMVKGKYITLLFYYIIILLLLLYYYIIKHITNEYFHEAHTKRTL